MTKGLRYGIGLKSGIPANQKPFLISKQVADDAKHTYTIGRARNISETTKKRQMEVIDYFEKMVQKQNITDYL